MTALQIKARAKVIFSKTYGYPKMPFRSIGRRCFAACLRQARAELIEAARVAAIPADVKAARVTALNRELELLPYADSYRTVQNRGAAIRAELAKLAA